MEKGSQNFFRNSQPLGIFISKIKKILWIFGKNAFLLILFFILLDIIWGGFLFYQYLLSANTEESEIVNISTKFKENIYQSVLKELQEREIIFKNLP